MDKRLEATIATCAYHDVFLNEPKHGITRVCGAPFNHGNPYNKQDDWTGIVTKRWKFNDENYLKPIGEYLGCRNNSHLTQETFGAIQKQLPKDINPRYVFSLRQATGFDFPQYLKTNIPDTDHSICPWCCFNNPLIQEIRSQWALKDLNPNEFINDKLEPILYHAIILFSRYLNSCANKLVQLRQEELERAKEQK